MVNKTKKTERDDLEIRLPILFGLLLSGLVLLVGTACSMRPRNLVPLRFSDRTIYMERVATAETREQGLSYRRALAPDRGMLFVYDSPGIHCHWMKDMNFPIDIIFVDEHKKVLNFDENVQSSSFPKIYCSTSPAKYVIELKAGTIHAINNHRR